MNDFLAGGDAVIAVVVVFVGGGGGGGCNAPQKQVTTATIAGGQATP